MNLAVWAKFITKQGATKIDELDEDDGYMLQEHEKKTYINALTCKAEKKIVKIYSFIWKEII